MAQGQPATTRLAERKFLPNIIDKRSTLARAMRLVDADLVPFCYPNRSGGMIGQWSQLPLPFFFGGAFGPEGLAAPPTRPGRFAETPPIALGALWQ